MIPFVDGTKVRTGEWVTVRQEAHLTGECVATWYSRARQEASRAIANGRKSKAVKAPQGGTCARLILWLHVSIDPRMRRVLDEQVRLDEARKWDCPAHVVQRAKRKLRWLIAWRKSCLARRGRRPTASALADRIVRQARKVEGPRFRISTRTLQVWWRRYVSCSPTGGWAGLEGLIGEW